MNQFRENIKNLKNIKNMSNVAQNTESAGKNLLQNFPKHVKRDPEIGVTVAVTTAAVVAAGLLLASKRKTTPTDTTTKSTTTTDNAINKTIPKATDDKLPSFFRHDPW